MTKFLAALAVLTVIATPTFAQSFCSCDGTGNVLKFTDNPITYQNKAPAITAMTPSALGTFAMAPRRANERFKSNDAKAADGGGSNHL